MHKIVPARALALIAGCGLLAACAGPQPAAYSGLASAGYLKPNQGGNAAQMPYVYASQANLQSYKKLIIDPVTVYQGPDNQFGGMSAANRTALALYMQTQFSKKLASHFTLTDSPDPDALRLKLTLTGGKTSTPVLSTFSHIDLGGNLYNGIQAVRGGPGLMTGYVMYSVEIYDARTNQLLEAFETKQYPFSENVVATVGSLAAAKAGINQGADALVQQLD